MTRKSAPPSTPRAIIRAWWPGCPSATSGSSASAAISPTSPASAGFTDARQASFYRELRQRFPATDAHAFAYFAAFDAPWRSEDASPVPGAHPEEAHWGLYDAARRAKTAARELRLLTSPPSPP